MSKVTDSVDPAVPLPADPDPAQTGPTLTERMDTWTPDQWDHWNLHGTEAAAAPPADQKEDAPAATVQTEAPKAAPVSGPDIHKEPQSEDKLSRRNRKIGELSAENRRLQRELAARPPNAPAAAAPSAETAPGKPVRPKLADYQDKPTEEWEAAMEVYEGKLTDWKIDQRDSKREAEDQKRRQDEARTEAEQKHEELSESLLEKETAFVGSDKPRTEAYLAAKEEVADFFDHLPPRHPLNELQRLIVESRSPELIHYLGTHPKEFDQIIRQPTLGEVIAEFGAIKASVQTSLKKTLKPNLTTKVGDPPDQLSARQERVSGPATGSAEWEELENARDIKRRLG